jgi:dephospho-CoA kinase
MQPASVGLTGGIGAGKSSVAAIIEALGYPVFYSDLESKKIINNPAVLQELCGIFGETIVRNNTLDRTALAYIVFNNSKKLELLNSILHPKVRAAFDVWRAKQNTEMVFNEAAILFETGAHNRFDKVLLVVADKHIRMKRISHRDNATEDEILARMDKQWADDRKVSLADVVIENNGVEALTPKVKKVISELSNLFKARS